MIYLSPQQVLFIHSRLIDATGGAHGVRDVALLQSAVARSRATFEGKDLYPDIHDKAAALMESLVRDHPFVGGNKRTAVTSAAILLEMNGYKLETTQTELERFALEAATGKRSFNDLANWFRRHARKKRDSAQSDQ